MSDRIPRKLNTVDDAWVKQAQIDRGACRPVVYVARSVPGALVVGEIALDKGLNAEQRRHQDSFSCEGGADTANLVGIIRLVGTINADDDAVVPRIPEGLVITTKP